METDEGVAAASLDALAAAVQALSRARTLGEAAGAIAAAVGASAGADAAVCRVADERGELVARGVFASSRVLAARLEGSRIAAAELPEHEDAGSVALPAAVRRAAERERLDAVLLVPVRLEGAPAASLELLRAGPPFGERELQLARVAAHQLALAARSLAAESGRARPNGALALAGEALVAGLEAGRTPEGVVRLAAEASGAAAALLWRVAGAEPELGAAHGAEATSAELASAAEAAASALGRREPLTLAEGSFAGGATASVTLQLGQPVVGALQLLFAPDRVPAGDDLARLATFGIRAAQALRAGAGAIGVERELERTRALLDVLGVATARLSLKHTLETTLEKTASLVGTDRLEIYLRVDGRLVAGTDARLHGPHLAVAERLLELLDGPYRARTVLAFDDVGAEPQLASVAAAARESGIDAAVAVPLRVHDEDLGLVPVGLVGIFPPRGRALASGEVALLSALAGQVAVAVQNARLHEQAKEQEERLTAALGRERRAAAQLRAFYTISQAFSEGEASVDGMLEAVVDTVVGELDVDAALISMPDERREVLVPRRLRVADDRLAEAAETILFRPQPLTARPIRRLLGERRPLRLDPAAVRGLDGELALLAPFLEKGWTGAIVPIHTPTELLAVLTLLSLRPGRPIAASTLEGAQRIAAHAAVALDRARLYEQQKEFADTMQRSLLPRERPEPPGLEVGAAYTVSAKVDVGGDVFDFLELGDGRLAVVLGDVTGHGIEATADMAMAKFVFRSLAREHPEPGDFLAAANTVVTGEIAPGKFITMHYLVLDGRTGVLACAGAGHPPPRLLDADGTVRPLEARGLVLGVADGQVYEEVHDRVAPGGAVVLYTDGVVEARRGGELFGTERLDELLASRRGLAPQELAEAVLDECRAYAGGELGDDCAVVVVRRA